jgi:hypothetical protein
VIRVRLVADTVEELQQTAIAVGRVLCITSASRPRPRRSGDGVALYLDAELFPDALTNSSMSGSAERRSLPSGARRR